jgi:hypothetical protein
MLLFAPAFVATFSLSSLGCNVFGTSLDGYAQGQGEQTADASTSDTSDANAANAPNEAGEQQQGLVLSPTSHDFSQVVMGQKSQTATFTLHNYGPSVTDTLLPSIQDSATDFELDYSDAANCDGLRLDVGMECFVQVRFAPSKLGKQTTKLVITDSTSQALTSADLLGTGVQEHTITITPPVTSFGDVLVGNKSSPKDLLLTNVGDSSTNVDVQLAGDHPDEFSLDASGCAGQLAPKASCLLKLSATPGNRGTFSAKIEATTDKNDAVSVQAFVTGLNDARLVASPTTVDFGIIAPNSSGDVLEVQLDNTGDVTAKNIKFKIEQSDESSKTFVIDSSDCTSLGPSQTCLAKMHFSPPVDGTYYGKLRIEGSPGGSTTVDLLGKAETSALSITPSSYQYASIPAQSDSKGKALSHTFSIKNTGSASLKNIQVSVSGANKYTPFSMLSSDNTCTNIKTLATGESCKVVVLFATFPHAKPGAYSAVLEASASNQNIGSLTQATALLKGTLLSPAKLDFSPTQHDFGTVVLGNSSKSRVFRLTNIGQTSTLSSISTTLGGLGPIQFNEVYNGCQNKVLLPSQFCDVSIAFSPNHTGTYNATLTAKNSSGDLSAQATMTGTATNNNKPPRE